MLNRVNVLVVALLLGLAGSSVFAQTTNLQLAMDRTAAAKLEMQQADATSLQAMCKFIGDWVVEYEKAKVAGDGEKVRKLVNLINRECTEFAKTLVLTNPVPGNPSDYDVELQWVYNTPPMSNKDFAGRAEVRAMDKRSRLTAEQLRSSKSPAISYYNDATVQFKNCTAIAVAFTDSLRGFQVELDALK